MTLTIALAVLFSALLHAVWNSLAHGASDRLVGFALIGVVDAVGGAAMAAVGGLPPAGAWPFIVASAALHVVYNLLLLASYQLGEFSQMYPLARGTSPWVVALVSIVVLGHDLPIGQLLGVLAVSAGLIALVLVGGRPGRRELPALAVAMLTGLMIAAYTVVDGVGVMQAPLWSYTGWMFLLQGPPIAVIALIRRRRAGLSRSVRMSAASGAAGGVISLTAYTIVLWAQTSGALAPIAALRETSIVFGALIGAWFLDEKMGARRAIAAGVVLAGVLLISLT
ncbi:MULTISPECIES: DMT family transporter [Mycolicibacterium]|jgi:drug/metabolite transporter (DMT)-like permease|uniref:EamA family transporter n=2 Tax=Mycolicibacterium TaxID=1866885 RepID=A0A9X3BVX3_9MYCO|nr:MULTISPECIES: DMT family transporter [Mycolicibacterium]MCV7171001.1 EamA family transporter [[Mycobacterium] manitobense]MDO3638786.1 DMT family transporter [Mycolicibacterium arseniciresistens]